MSKFQYIIERSEVVAFSIARSDCTAATADQFGTMCELLQDICGISSQDYPLHSRERAEHGLSLARTASCKRFELWFAGLSAAAQLQFHDVVSASKLARISYDLATSFGDDLDKMRSTALSAATFQLAGDVATASKWRDAALAMAKQVRSPIPVARIFAGLSQDLLATGQVSKAKQLLAHAAQVTEYLDGFSGRGALLFAQACAAISADEAEAALRFADRGLIWAVSQNSEYWQRECALVYAEAAMRLGKYADALECCRVSHSWFLNVGLLQRAERAARLELQVIASMLANAELTGCSARLNTSNEAVRRAYTQRVASAAAQAQLLETSLQSNATLRRETVALSLQVLDAKLDALRASSVMDEMRSDAPGDRSKFQSKPSTLAKIESWLGLRQGAECFVCISWQRQDVCWPLGPDFVRALKVACVPADVYAAVDSPRVWLYLRATGHVRAKHFLGTLLDKAVWRAPNVGEPTCVVQVMLSKDYIATALDIMAAVAKAERRMMTNPTPTCAPSPIRVLRVRLRRR